MSFKFSFKCSQKLRKRHFWWQTVPSSCCSDRERPVADRGLPSSVIRCKRFIGAVPDTWLLDCGSNLLAGNSRGTLNKLLSLLCAQANSASYSQLGEK